MCIYLFVIALFLLPVKCVLWLDANYQVLNIMMMMIIKITTLRVTE